MYEKDVFAVVGCEGVTEGCVQSLDDARRENALSFEFHLGWVPEVEDCFPLGEFLCTWDGGCGRR